MSHASFRGFPPGKPRTFALPAAFMTDLLPLVDHLGELCVTLYAFYAIQQREGRFRYVARTDFAASEHMRGALGRAMPHLPFEDALEEALARACARGALLAVEVNDDVLYFINAEPGRAAIEQIQRGQWQPTPDGSIEILPERPNIFQLYEDNIGPLTPLIADALKDAASEYAATWIEAAFREAVQNNARSWRYIQAVLERWRKEGRHGAAQPDTETDGNRYISGKYADFIEH
jgi:DnaD/phage-associated family protein